MTYNNNIYVCVYRMYIFYKLYLSKYILVSSNTYLYNFICVVSALINKYVANNHQLLINNDIIIFKSPYMFCLL